MAYITRINGKDVKDAKASQDITDLKSHFTDLDNRVSGIDGIVFPLDLSIKAMRATVGSAISFVTDNKRATTLQAIETTVPTFIDLSAFGNTLIDTYVATVNSQDVVQSVSGWQLKQKSISLPAGRFYISLKTNPESTWTDEMIPDDLAGVDVNGGRIDVLEEQVQNSSGTVNAVKEYIGIVPMLNLTIDGIVSTVGQTVTHNGAKTRIITKNAVTTHAASILDMRNTEFIPYITYVDANDIVLSVTGYISEKIVLIPASSFYITLKTNPERTFVNSDIPEINLIVPSAEYQSTINDIYGEIAKTVLFDRNSDAEQLIGSAKRKRNESSNYTKNKVTVCHISDTHGDAPRWNNAVKLIEHYVPNIVVHTGDVHVQNLSTSSAEYITGNLPSMATLIAAGNHDVIKSNAPATQAETFERLVEPLIEAYSLSTDKLYYYYDIGNVRFIVLNVYDYPNAQTTGIASKIHYSQTQIDWFISVLQDAITNSKAVVVCAHECDVYLSASNGSGVFNQDWDTAQYYSKDWEGNPICDIIEAFIQGGSMSQTYEQTDISVTLTVSASFSSSGHFVAWLVGHRHADHCGFLPGYSQYMLSVTSGYTTIFSKNDANYYQDIPRIEGTKTEDAFNFIAIDTTAHTLEVVRIGSNKTIDFTDRSCMSVSYVPN